jgi:hypothetical protein
MEYLDKLIPLAVLGAVGAFLLFVLRRVTREQDVAPRSAELTMRVEAKPKPVIAVAQEKKQIASEALAKREDEKVAVASSVIPMPAERPKKKKRTPSVVVPAEMPIQTVLGLLKDKDTLAAAFLLREILAPPVSKRR